MGLLLVALAAALARAGPQVPSFPTEARLVTVDVLVLDRDGQPVPGLSADDFLVLEDGVAQPVASFEAFDQGPSPPSLPASRPPAREFSSRETRPRGARSFVLLVDDEGLGASRVADVRRAIDRFVDEGLQDGDEVLFATASGSHWWSARVPEGREDLHALAARLRGLRLAETAADYMSDWEAFRIARVESPTGAALESTGAPLAADGPPTGGPGASGAAVAAPGTSLTERVVTRWLERRVCDPLALGLCRSMVDSRARQIDRARQNRTRDVLARIDQAVFALSTQRGRKSLLLLTEGFLNDPDLDVDRLVVGRCREANMAVYTLDVRGLIAGTTDLSAASAGGAPNAAELSLMRQEEVEFQAAGSVALAQDTGGFAFRDSNDLGGGAVRVADESRVYYLLGIAPSPGKGPGDWRKLQVKTRRPGLVVRARKGYTLRTSAEIAAAEQATQAQRRAAPGGKSGGEALPIEVSRALASGLDRAEIPLRAMAFVLGPAPEGRVHALVALEADLGRIANLGGEDHPTAVLSLSVVVTHRDSGEIRRTDEQVKVAADPAPSGLAGGLTLARGFDLRPGVNQARVVVEDGFLGRTGAVTVRFDVPAPGGFRLSTPMLTDHTLARPGQAARPVFVARRTFGAGGTLFCQYEVYGATPPPGRKPPPLEASYTLRRADGTLVDQGRPAPLDPDPTGRFVQLLRLALPGASAGDYELTLKVDDAKSGASAVQTEAFRLTAN
jgi:VWFA-related protein